MAEGELGVAIVPDESALEDIEDREIGVTGPSGPGGDSDSDGGGALAGIGKKLTLILGALGVLSQLDTIMELLDGIFRAIEVALLPLVALITAFLRPVLTKLLRLFADFSFDNIFSQISDLIDESISGVSSEIQNVLPDFAPEETGETITRSGGRQAVETVVETAAPGVGNTILDLIGNEFSNAGIDKIFSNSGQEVQNEDSPG